MRLSTTRRRGWCWCGGKHQSLVDERRLLITRTVWRQVTIWRWREASDATTRFAVDVVFVLRSCIASPLHFSTSANSAAARNTAAARKTGLIRHCWFISHLRQQITSSRCCCSSFSAKASFGDFEFRRSGLLIHTTKNCQSFIFCLSLKYVSHLRAGKSDF